MGTVFKKTATKPLPAGAKIFVRKPGILRSILDKATSNRGEAVEAGAVAASACPVKRKDPLTSMVNGRCVVEDRGLEPLTFWMPSRRSPN